MGRLGGYRLPHPEPGDRGRGVHDQRGTVRRIDEYGGDDRGYLCDHCADCDYGAVCRHGGKHVIGGICRGANYAAFLYRLYVYDDVVDGVHVRTDDCHDSLVKAVRFGEYIQGGVYPGGV